MVLKMRLYSVVTQRCICCGQQLIEESRDPTPAEHDVLASADPYVLCPVCLQSIAPSLRADEEFRRRVRVAMFVRYNIVTRELWHPDYDEHPSETHHYSGKRRYDVDD